MQGLKQIIKLTLLLSIPVLAAILIWNFKNRNNYPLCPNCNVILVSLDTLSAEHLPCYGYNRNTSPKLCEYAKQNIWFKNAYANSSWTLPSATTTFTGLYPETHKVLKRKDTLANNKPFLPEILKKNGYETMVVIPEHDPSLPRQTVFNRGIDNFFSEPIPWETVLYEFKERVNSGKKTFLFIHDYSVHAPYFAEDNQLRYDVKPVNEIPTKRSDIYNNISNEFLDYLESQVPIDIERGELDPEVFQPLVDYFKNNNDYEKKRKFFLDFNQKYPSLNWYYLYEFNWRRKVDIDNKDHIEYIKALYDHQINILDETKLSFLFNFLSDKEISENTVVLITGEHGEEFAEHGEFTHLTIYNPNIKIPFAISVPGSKGKEFGKPVQLADITPTLLDILGIKHEYEFQGKSLVDLMRGSHFEDRIIIIDGTETGRKALIWNNWKLFLNMHDGLAPLELYDLEKDPQEKNNILFKNFDLAEDMIDKYRNMRETN